MLISYLVNINLSYFQNGTLWYLYGVIFQISDAHLVIFIGEAPGKESRKNKTIAKVCSTYVAQHGSNWNRMLCQLVLANSAKQIVKGMDSKYSDEICFGVYDGRNILGGKVSLYHDLELEASYEPLKC